MILILPKQEKGILAVEKTITDQQVSDWRKRGQTQLVEVYVPRFKMEWGAGLKTALQEAGLKAPFHTDRADFSKMVTQQPPEGKLYIADVIQKTFIDVNEIGTEAAAATAVLMKSGAALGEPEPKTFRADHPFLFLIRDNKINADLFVGRLVKP